MTGKGVNLVDSPEKLPKSEGTAYRAIKDGARVMGWFNIKTGQVYIYTPNARNYNEVMKTLLHEFVAHKGLRNMLGAKEFDKLCRDVWKMMPYDQRLQYAVYVTKRIAIGSRAMREYIKNLSLYESAALLGNEKAQLAAADEYMAHFAERGITEQNRSTFRKVADAIRDLLRKIGFDVLLSDRDIARLLHESKTRLTQDMSLEEMVKTITNLNGIESFDNQVRYCKDGEIVETSDDIRFYIGGTSYTPATDYTLTDEARHEMQTIRDEAIANGTYMKAPNGRPTNLNERQWLQVRTKAFLEYFGDWLKAARIDKLRKSEPIENRYNGDYELNRDSAKQWIKENLRGEYTIADTGEKVSISRVSANELTSHGEREEMHLKSFAFVPEMIENATFIEEQSNHKNNDKYDSYRYYVVGLKIGGVDYTARLVVGVKNGKTYYDH